jgi:hypothetical protein
MSSSSSDAGPPVKFIAPVSAAAVVTRPPLPRPPLPRRVIIFETTGAAAALRRLTNALTLLPPRVAAVVVGLAPEACATGITHVVATIVCVWVRVYPNSNSRRLFLPKMPKRY